MSDRLRRGLVVCLHLSVFIWPLTSGQMNRVFAGQSYGLIELSHALVIVHGLMIAIAGVRMRSERALLKGLEWLWLLLYPTLMVYLSVQATSIFMNAERGRVSLAFGTYVWILAVALQISMQKYATGLGLLSFGAILLSFQLGFLAQLGLYLEYLNRTQTFYLELARHLNLSFAAVLSAMIPGIFFGYVAAQKARWREWILGMVNTFQVAPTLSMLALIMVALTVLSTQIPALRALGVRGIGFYPAYVVMSLYALMPITIHSMTAFSYVDASVIESAQGIGLTPQQTLLRIRLPLASPHIVTGVRLAFIQTLGNALLAGLVGAGGMGSLIFLGLSQSAVDLVLLGSLPIIVLAIVFEFLFESFEQRLFRWVGVAHD
jgi:osmoprotectant transport system permease protein